MLNTRKAHYGSRSLAAEALATEDDASLSLEVPVGATAWATADLVKLTLSADDSRRKAKKGMSVGSDVEQLHNT
eukprot:m.125954 g.125954  ORF g.125954 m.125954 type:complete len:74 (-) comp15764_c0_seq2:38-259(-)